MNLGSPINHLITYGVEMSFYGWATLPLTQSTASKHLMIKFLVTGDWEARPQPSENQVLKDNVQNSDKEDLQILSRLRQYPIPRTKTNKYHSFLSTMP